MVIFHNDILYLSLCAINGTKPDVGYVEKIDLEALFKESKRHNLTALVCYAIESVIQLPVYWQEAKGKAIRKDMLFEAERARVTAFFDKNGIRYMPLKGILLKDYYPYIGMREMADNDIYYDIAFREQLEQYMLSLGYKCKLKAEDHDIYEKEPVYNFEFHHRLFLKDASEKLYNYYRDIDKRMLRADDSTFCYHLSNEDLYVYLIAHEYKHYIHSGTGLRSLIDCVVFHNKFSDTLDWEYIISETEKAGIAEFESQQRTLCNKISGSVKGETVSMDEYEFLEYLDVCGVHGNLDIKVKNKCTGKAGTYTKITFLMKAKYIFRRLFPEIEYYKIAYPFFYKYRYLLPLCVLFRMFKAILKPSSLLKKEIKILNK